MDWNWLTDWNWLKDWSGWDWAGWLGVAVALVYGIQQIRCSREDAREATAIQTWMEYYLRSLEYPQYACPELLKLDYDKLDENDSVLNS